MNAVVMIAGLTFAFVVADEPVQQVTDKPRMVAQVLDCSGSMAGKKATAMKEGAKLATAILDGQHQLTVINFSSTALASKPFRLGSPDLRKAAMDHIDSLQIEGGTNYLAALKAGRFPPDTPSIFISDGEHNGDPADVLDYLKKHPRGPIFTVAVECQPNSPAEKLLSQMAAMTGGSYVRVENSDALVKTFVDIAKQLANYRTFKPDKDEVA